MEIFLKEYLNILELEKNLSDNTTISYKNDITSFFKFLKEYNISDPSQIETEHISRFFNSLKDIGLTSSSAARYFSSIKGFFKYLYINRYIVKNPMEKITSPKLSKNLPVVLSIDEVDRMLSRPDTTDKLGLRDKALLEIFYACGLRVSELINLKISSLYFSEEIIRVTGKGSKERLVPIGRSAVKWTEEYIKTSRTILKEV